MVILLECSERSAVSMELRQTALLVNEGAVNGVNAAGGNSVSKVLWRQAV